MAFLETEKKNKVLKWNFIFQYGYVVTNILNALLLLPLYLIFIDATTFGLWLATGNLLAWLTMTDPGIGEIMQQKIAELSGKKDYLEIRKTIGSGFIAISFIFFLSLVVGLGLYMALETVLSRDLSGFRDLRVAFAISIVATGLSLVYFGLSGINQGLHNAFHVAISSLISNILFLVVNLVLLYLDFGVVAIALANLARAVFLNFYNTFSILSLLRKSQQAVVYQLKHLKGFLQLFSYTSLAKIVLNITNNIDLLILARYLPANLVVMFEINRRPIKMVQMLVGRHSVAIMPTVSYEKGKVKDFILSQFINRQLKIYCYFLLCSLFLLWINYENLITLWIGSDQYAGDTILALLLVSFFVKTLGYFMANIGYALGDIKRNSSINIINGILIGALSLILVKPYGIIGVLIAFILVDTFIYLTFFSFRLYKLGYLRISLRNQIRKGHIIILPATVLLALGIDQVMNNFQAESLGVFYQVLISTGVFLILYFTLLLIDKSLRRWVLQVIHHISIKSGRIKVVFSKNYTD